MTVVLLLVAIWAFVLIPPAVRAQRSRRNAFEISFGRAAAPDTPGRPAKHRRHSPPVRRRRRIAGGLIVAMAASGTAGLVLMFRSLLVVHLFVVDAFLFYLAVLARRAERGSGVLRSVPASSGDAAGGTRPAPPVRARARRRPALAELPPVASTS